ncbi:MAG: hypothetical protein Q7V88_05070 [Actinomycetota bacterium]|nr:hypothetical protein [Actinomycetota bacterium]
MSDWWKGVEDALAAHSAEAPDPWAHLAAELPALTDEQLSFLEQVAAQPAPARLSDDDDDHDHHDHDHDDDHDHDHDHDHDDDVVPPAGD